MTHQLTPLPDIDDVEPVGPADEIIFSEIREVLQRHGALSRFGVTLLHQHFPIGDDEVLLESIDRENRVLTSTPELKDGISRSVQTSWRLDSPSGAKECETRCRTQKGYDGTETHYGAHYTVS